MCAPLFGGEGGATRMAGHWRHARRAPRDAAMPAAPAAAPAADAPAAAPAADARTQESSTFQQSFSFWPGRLFWICFPGASAPGELRGFLHRVSGGIPMYVRGASDENPSCTFPARLRRKRVLRHFCSLGSHIPPVPVEQIWDVLIGLYSEKREVQSVEAGSGLLHALPSLCVISPLPLTP
jgi:hypothetical protein